VTTEATPARDWTRLPGCNGLIQLILLIRRLLRLCNPPFEPDRWNSDPAIRRNNNCYNYACNYASNTFAQPGRYSASPYTPTSASMISCSNVANAAASDGLVPVDCDTECAVDGACTYHVALVVAPGVDFHWYRLDRDGRWSHKPGSTNATNLDNSGTVITDPRTANRGPYTQFCGCFCVRVGQHVE
jgi:hypothetical protein